MRKPAVPKSGQKFVDQGSDGPRIDYPVIDLSPWPPAFSKFESEVERTTIHT